jgi:hypothetical protein
MQGEILQDKVSASTTEKSVSTESKQEPPTTKRRTHEETDTELVEKIHLVETIGKLVSAVTNEHTGVEWDISSLLYMVHLELDPQHGTQR